MTKIDTSRFLWSADIEDTFIAAPFPATGKIRNIIAAYKNGQR